MTDRVSFRGALGCASLSHQLHTFYRNRLRRAGTAVGPAGAPYQWNDF